MGIRGGGAVDILVPLLKGLAELLGAGAQTGLAALHCPGPAPKGPTYRSESVLFLFVEGTAVPAGGKQNSYTQSWMCCVQEDCGWHPRAP